MNAGEIRRFSRNRRWHGFLRRQLIRLRRGGSPGCMHELPGRSQSFETHDPIVMSENGQSIC
jgi:hypothetical protein